MDHAVIQEVILSMPRRMAAVIQAGGGNTRYTDLEKPRPSGQACIICLSSSI
jgi:hypothetical protein